MKITDPNKVPKRKTVKGVLRQVRKLLSDYDNWIQGEWFTHPGDPDGKEDRFCYCLNGAIDAVAADPALAAKVKQEVGNAIPARFLAKQYRGQQGNLDFRHDVDAETPIIDLNDGTFHKTDKGAWKAILNTLDRALSA